MNRPATYLAILFAALFVSTEGQDVSWTWLKGSPTSNVQTTSKQPGGRSGATYWMQADNQTLWVFGGEEHVEHNQPGLTNDLWKYELESGTWELVHNGTSSTHGVPAPRQLAAGCGIIDSYFVLFGGLAEQSDNKQSAGKEQSSLGDTWLFYIEDKQWYTLEEIRTKLGASNDTVGPAARGDMASWCSSSQEMIVFGGFKNGLGLHNDLWRFNLQTLSWKQSERSESMPRDGEFISHLPYPEGRSGATTWLVEDKLYMFGGNIYPNSFRSMHLMVGNTGGMWQYDILKDEWAFLKGEQKACRTSGSYGILGTASTSNEPGCRRKAASWIDAKGNLWMFGGDGVDASQKSVSVFKHSKLLSDIWYFDTKTIKWTWKGGSVAGEQKGEYTEDKGEESRDHHPGSRCEAVCWTVGNDLFLFGGVGHDGNGQDGYLNDIWKLNVNLDTSVMRNKPYPGPVFGIILSGIGLIVFVAIIYSLNKRQDVPDYTSGRRSYSRISADEPDF